MSDGFIGLATNRPDTDVKKYAGRRGIDTAYSKTEAMRPRTRSKNVDLQLFGCLLPICNALVLANPLPACRSIPAKRPTITQIAFKIALDINPHRQPPEPPPEPVVS